MPNPGEIVSSLAEIARTWPLLALWWHLYFAVCVIALIAGFKPSRRLFGLAMVAPMLSVSALAWLGSNPFNGTIFAFAAIVFIAVAARIGVGNVRLAPWPFVIAGGLLFAFGWLYPHFIDAASILTYLYATPLGLIPCPTLSAIVGLTVMFGGLGSRPWSSTLGVLAAFYGIYGALVLEVEIDWVLAAGALFVVVALYSGEPGRHVR